MEEPSKSDPANRPETNKPQSGTRVAQPGHPLDAAGLGDLNSRVVPPYGQADLGPVRVSPQSQDPSVKVQADYPKGINERPAGTKQQEPAKPAATPAPKQDK